MLVTLTLLFLAYMIIDKDVKPLVARIKRVDWRSKIIRLEEKLRPWAIKVGRITARPMLQFFYVMKDEKTTTLDRALIYGAIVYTILPMDLLPRAVFKILGILDDGVAVLYVYKKIKGKITPEIDAKVEDTLNEWFGVEYEMVEG